MKKLSLAILSFLVFTGLCFGAGKERTFTGAIMDSQCSMMGSHEKMEAMHQDKLQQMGVKASDDLTGKAARACTLMCVKQGGKFVLFNKEKKVVYMLDDQEKPEEFAGQNVKVTGTYDKKSKTIHVASIEAAS